MSAAQKGLLSLHVDSVPSRRVTVSFRDPGGRVVIADQRAFRVVNPEYDETLTRLFETKLYAQLVSGEQLIGTRVVDDQHLKQQLIQAVLPEHPDSLVFEHDFIAFPSYPYEWPPEMLYAAGELTLNLMEKLLSASFGLKDASPYNVLFRGSKPIFIDLLSLESRESRDSTWLAYAQFTRNFIRPLLADKYFGVGLDQTFRVHRDGLQPEDVFKLSSSWQKLHPSFLTSVSLPTLLSRIDPSRYQKIYKPRLSRSHEQAAFVLKRQLQGLRRKLKAVKPLETRKSTWCGYEDQTQDREQYLPVKSAFVERALTEQTIKTVLDVGCNFGHFSLLAAKAGCSVVAIDQDPVVVGGLWRRGNAANLNVLPLVINIARPTPGLGWRNRETIAFLDRALGTFQCVFMLAVIHHLLVTERIPLDEIIRLASELTTDMLIIEFISPQDPMFQLITRGNANLYQYLTRELFESAIAKYFVIERSEQVENSGRWLYQLRRTEVV